MGSGNSEPKGRNKGSGQCGSSEVNMQEREREVKSRKGN